MKEILILSPFVTPENLKLCDYLCIKKLIEENDHETYAMLKKMEYKLLFIDAAKTALDWVRKYYKDCTLIEFFNLIFPNHKDLSQDLCPDLFNKYFTCLDDETMHVDTDSNYCQTCLNETLYITV